MKRRLYFLFSSREQARTAIADLDGLGIATGHMHVLARPGMDLSGLPPATDRQRRDSLKRVEKILQRANKLLFGIVFAGLFVAAVLGNRVGMVLATGVLIVSFVSSALFALRRPTVHLDEFQEALRHGELLLMVDVPRACMHDVEELIRQRHPQAVTGGSTWTPGIFGV